VKRLLVLVLSLAGILLFTSLPGAGVEAADTAAAARPILECADVNGDGPTAAGDIGTVVSKFGRLAGQPGYHLMYEVGPSVDNVIAAADIAGVVADFGLNCATNKPDTQIARATLWSANLLPGGMNPPAWATACAAGNPAPPLTENMAVLDAAGWYRASTDVPGQGYHYIKGINWEDNTFDPCRPEGLVYLNAGGPLAALLYVPNGDTVGWGAFAPPYGGPVPVNQQNIDTFCSPQPCSWTSPPGATYGDGWHIHFNLCTTHIGMANAAAIPGIPDSSSPDEDQSSCTNPNVPVCNVWDDQTGWMGHVWVGIPNPNRNPHDVNNNGRFADCLPDGSIWKAFSCPQ
jgi:hypothetical protein